MKDAIAFVLIIGAIFASLPVGIIVLDMIAEPLGVVWLALYPFAVIAVMQINLTRA